MLKAHGVTVKILTGDNGLVARKVCRDVGLHVEHFLSGVDVERFDDEKLREVVEYTTVFAKSSPRRRKPAWCAR